MIIYPAIDLIEGHAVRLLHGDFNHVTRYDSHPANRLAAFAAEGAEWIHVIDLDGAKAGEARQYELIGDMARAVDIKVQSGGGVRSAKDIEHLLGAGISRVVIGSLAVTDTDQVLKWLEQFGPDAIALALDVRYEDGLPVPALKGWTQSSGVTLWDALDRYPEGTAKHLLVTDVGRDGALTGPNLELLAEIRRRRPDLVLQASGGVSSLDDLSAVKALGCNGAIVGRALYENRFTLPEAIAAAA